MTQLWVREWVADYERMKALTRHLKLGEYQRRIDELNAALQEGIYG